MGEKTLQEKESLKESKDKQKPECPSNSEIMDETSESQKDANETTENDHEDTIEKSVKEKELPLENNVEQEKIQNHELPSVSELPENNPEQGLKSPIKEKEPVAGSSGTQMQKQDFEFPNLKKQGFEFPNFVESKGKSLLSPSVVIEKVQTILVGAQSSKELSPKSTSSQEHDENFEPSTDHSDISVSDECKETHENVEKKPS